MKSAAQAYTLHVFASGKLVDFGFDKIVGEGYLGGLLVVGVGGQREALVRGVT